MSGDPTCGYITAGQAACGCWTGPWWGVTPPPQCAMHAGGWLKLSGPPAQPWPLPQRLADEDIERIARRLAQLLKAKSCSCGPGDACSECPR